MRVFGGDGTAKARRPDVDGGAHVAGNRDFQLYLEVKLRFEAIRFPKTVIDTELAIADCTEEGLRALR